MTQLRGSDKQRATTMTVNDNQQSECVPMRVSQLRVGDQVDLDSCPHLGDKDGFWNTEYAEVEHIERETADCTCVYWEGIDAVGYSPDQILQVKRRSKR